MTLTGKKACFKRNTLKFEYLEERRLLSAVPLSAGEYEELTAKYSALELPETMNDLNVITLDLAEGDGLTELKAAITKAGKTKQSDLIVIRTSSDANTITYAAAEDRLDVSINSSSYGSLFIVGLGEAPLTLDADQHGNHLYLHHSSMDISLANLTLTGGNHTNGYVIFNSSRSLTITDCAITGNTGSGSGAIYSQGYGMTIVNTLFSDNTSESFGGAIRYTRGKCTITNSVFSENSAKSGGSIYAESLLVITDSEILNNTAAISGGGIYSSGDVEILNSRIDGNTADSGGGIFNTGRYVTVTDSVFSQNRSGQIGGGIYNQLYSEMKLVNVRVAENYAEHISGTESRDICGGGICNYGSADIQDCEIVNNFAHNSFTGDDEFASYVYGGGIYNDGNMTVTDSKISGNIARYENDSVSTEIGAYGGGICNEGSLTAANSIFTENLTDGKRGTVGELYTWGGGICSWEASLLALDNSVIAGNRASVGGGIHIYENKTSKISQCTIADNIAEIGGGIWNGSLLYVYNTIIADNGIETTDGRDIWTLDTNSARTMLTNSLVSRVEHETGKDFFHGGSLIGTAETPLSAGFVDAANGDYRLSAGSAAIEAGNDLIALPETDTDGAARLQGRHVDMGAYEFTQSEYVGTQETASTVVTTEKDIVDAYDGLISLREAVAYAENGGTITFDVAGNRVEVCTQLIIDKELTLSGTSPENQTVLDGLGITGILIIAENVGEVTLEALTLTDGFTRGLYINPGNKVTVIDSRIQKMRAEGLFGSAVYNNQSELFLLHCDITENSSTASGTLYSYYGTLTVTDCTVSKNSAASGAGISTEYGTWAITNSEITENTSSMSGGGVYTFYGTGEVLNCDISGNSAVYRGGGIYCYHSTMLVANTLVSENRAEYAGTENKNVFGGGICGDFCQSLTITNCTIAGNSAIRRGESAGTSAGGGIWNGTGSTMKVYNTIIAENTAEYGTDVYANYLALPGNNNLSTFDEWDMDTNYLYDSELPLFKDKENGDYSLAINDVQALDRGSNSYAAEAGIDESWKDMDGNNRIFKGIIDIGAYELYAICVLNVTSKVNSLDSKVMLEHQSRVNEWDTLNVECWSNFSTVQTFEIQCADIYVLDTENIRKQDGVEVTLSCGVMRNHVTTWTVTVECAENYTPLYGGQVLLASLTFKPSVENGLEAGCFISGALVISDGNHIRKTAAYSVIYDMNDDRHININDLVQFARLFGTSNDLTDPYFNENAWRADFDSNGSVDITDLVYFARNFGLETNPANISYSPNYVPQTDLSTAARIPVSALPELETSAVWETPAWSGLSQNLASESSRESDSQFASAVARTTDLAWNGIWDEEEEDDEQAEEKRRRMIMGGDF